MHKCCSHSNHHHPSLTSLRFLQTLFFPTYAPMKLQASHYNFALTSAAAVFMEAFGILRNTKIQADSMPKGCEVLPPEEGDSNSFIVLACLFEPVSPSLMVRGGVLELSGCYLSFPKLSDAVTPLFKLGI